MDPKASSQIKIVDEFISWLHGVPSTVVFKLASHFTDWSI